MGVKEFYVYVYLDPRIAGTFKYLEYEFEYEPFYVGKGTGDRYKAHMLKCCKGVNLHKDRKISNILKVGLVPIIVKIGITTDEQEAYDLERVLIQEIGRRIVGTGSLTNLEEGGLGGRKMSEHTRAKCSASNKGKVRTAEMRKNLSIARTGIKISDDKKDKLRARQPTMLNKNHTEETKQYLSYLASNRSEEHRRKLSEARKGKSCSEELKVHFSEVFKGEGNPNYGHKLDNYKLYLHSIYHTKIKYLIEDITTGTLIKTYKLKELAIEYNLDLATLMRTHQGSSIQHKGFKILDKVYLPHKWYTQVDLLEDYQSIHPYQCKETLSEEEA